MTCPAGTALQAGIATRNGKLKYCYNWGGFKYFMIGGRTTLSEGDHQVRMELVYAGAGLGKGGKVKGVLLSLGDDNGKHVIDPIDAIRIAMARQ